PLFGKEPDLTETLFNLRMTNKQLSRLAAKAEKEQAKEQAKVKKALQQRNVEGARIYAENAIRKKNESLNYLRFAARIDAVAARVQTAQTMKGVTKNIGQVTKDLERAMSSMNLEEVEKVMGKFEKTFEDLDVRTQTVESSMGNAMTLSAPEDQVSSLIQQVADENGLEVADQLAGLEPAAGATPGAASAQSEERKREDALNKRLAQLRQ
ncbi:hypothetical protein BOX15_Mlig029636g6, partial [Macrostomum lignano]